MKRLLFLILLLGVSYSALSADPLTDLTDQIHATADSTTVIDQKAEEHGLNIIEKYKLTNGGKCALLVVGTSTTSTIPIYFIPGPQPVSALQANLSTSTGTVSITKIAQGPDVAAYGKQLTSQQTGTAWTFIIFGLNQTPIGPGAMGIASLDTSKMAKGFTTVSLSNFVASDPNGNNVPMCVTTGVITK